MISKEDHERERRAFYDACCAAQVLRHPNELPFDSAESEARYASELATAKLAERDKVFPGPVEHSCENCKHEHVNWRKPPCVDCSKKNADYTNWEPKS
jgi:hypothetical protein